MVNKNFWFISLIAFFIIAAAQGWSIPMRVVVALNAVVVLIDVFKAARRLFSNGD